MSETGSSHRGSKMKKLLCTLSLLGSPLLAGCVSQLTSTEGLYAPQGQSFPHSYQLSLQASEHWRSVAADLSREVKQTLVKARQEQRRIYVQPPVGQSDFSKAFHEFLIDHLLKEEVRVATEAKAGLTLEYDLQMIKYAPGRKTSVTKAESEGRYLAGVPNAEVVIRSRIVENGLYLMQETGIYYINEQDSRLYDVLLRPDPLPTRNLAVKGCKPGGREC